MRETYHRLESPTQSPALAQQQKASGEVWGHPSRYSFLPKVRAYEGPLPAGEKGIEFETDVDPDPGSPPGKAVWGVGNPGVRLEGDVVKLKVLVTKVVT